VLSLPLVAVLVGVALGRRLPGTGVLARWPLQLAVALLGLQLSVTDVTRTGARHLVVVLVTVAVTFVGTQALARRLGFSRAQGLLVAAGFSVCGASAVAAMEPVAEAEEGDSGLAVALVTLCGSLAILVLPALRQPLGLDASTFGAWVGASVHDIGQVAATAGRAGTAALVPALVVKLCRVALLAPLVLAQSRRCVGPVRVAVPWFVPGFVVAAGLHSSGLLPAALLGALHSGQQVLLLVGLVGIGARVQLGQLRRLRWSATALGLGSWLLVAGTSYTLLRVVG
jgi:uncharacterized integral membrane protein (TIGR00698 family)